MDFEVAGGGEDVRKDIDGELAVLASVMEDDDGAGAHHAGDGPADITAWWVERIRGVGGAEDDALTSFFGCSEERGAEEGGWRADEAWLLAGDVGDHIGGFAHGIVSLGGGHADGGAVGDEVVGEFVTLFDDAAGECGVLADLFSHDEEGGVRISFGEKVEDLHGVVGAGAVIEGEGEDRFLGGDVEEDGGECAAERVNEPAWLVEPATDSEASSCDGHER